MHGNQIIHTLLMGMEIGVITLGNNLTGSYEAKHATTIWSNNCTNCTSGHISQTNKKFRSQETYTLVFIAVLYKIAKNLKHPKFPSISKLFICKQTGTSMPVIITQQ